MYHSYPTQLNGILSIGSRLEAIHLKTVKYRGNLLPKEVVSFARAKSTCAPID